jgi:hypothetical protein
MYAKLQRKHLKNMPTRSDLCVVFLLVQKVFCKLIFGFVVLGSQLMYGNAAMPTELNPQ